MLFKTQVNLANKKDDYLYNMINSFVSQKSNLEISPDKILPKNEQGFQTEKTENFLNTFKKTHLFQQAIFHTLNNLISVQKNLINTKEELIKQKNPVNNFFNKNETQFKDIKIEKRYIQKILFSDEKKQTISIKKSKDNTEAIRLIREETGSVYTTLMEGIDSNYFVQIFMDTEPVTLDKNAVLKINNCNLQSISLGTNFEKTKKVFVKNCLDLFGDVKLFDFFSRLKILSLKNCNIITYTFDFIIKHLMSNKNTLEYLSFEQNRITKVSFPLEETTNSPANFSNLKELNFENNRIYRIESTVFGLPENDSKFRVIYLSSNNFAFRENFINILETCKTREKKMVEKNPNKTRLDYRILILISKNLFLLREENRKEYLDYLNTTLADFNYPLKYLTLEMLFNAYNKDVLINLKLSNKIQNNLLHLNLSHCTLIDKNLTNFISNYSFPSLVKLNISYNDLSNAFFKEYCDLKLNEKLPSLLKINFTGNETLDIKNKKDYNSFILFTTINSNLKKIFFMRTIFDSTIQTYINNKIKLIRKFNDKNFKKMQQNYEPSEKERENEDEISKLNNLIETQGNTNIKYIFRSLRSKDTIEKVREHFDNQLKYFYFKERLFSSD